MADRFVANPIDVVSVGQKVKVRVIEVDLEREKVSLSMKSADYVPPKKTEQNPNTSSRANRDDNTMPETFMK